MIFGFRRKSPNLGLHMYGSSLERLKVFTFLGVWLDKRKAWAVHIANMLGKSNKVLNVIRSLAGCDWGADSETIRDY